ncbi:HAD-IA family hydrolase [Rossellomorea aquimaris]|uniref:HAD family hydrolase n=1 Tax=Rossellomorea aquimaris TaxID=189382 RepID=UPI001CD7D6D0|nr:HAD family hydrolase [Rossellomorea aquimaris]MCA1054279.1 HAD-IA family hydrolase [Rossellomorea aquimaris]
MKKISLLLFDLDDTLLDNSSWFDKGLTQCLSKHPLTINVDTVLFLELVKKPPRSLIDKLISGEYNTVEFKRARWKYALEQFNLTTDIETLDQLDTLFYKTSMDYITVNKSVLCLLNDLSKEYELGVVTNGLYDPQQKLMNMGLGKRLNSDKVFHAEQLGYRKPDPRIYSKALDYFNKQPSETLFIGDSWTHDVVAPMENGMEAIWVNSRNVSPSTSHMPYAIVSEIMEIRDLLLSKN